MAMSLEDLLAKEGFNRRMSKTMSRASSGTNGKTAPSDAKKTERVKSDIPWHNLKSKHIMSSYDISSDVKRISITSFDEFLSANEIGEVVEQNDSRCNCIYSNQTHRNDSSRSSSTNAEGAEAKKQSLGKDTQVATTKCLDKSSKKISGRPSFRDDYRKHMEQPETSYSRSTRSSLTNKSYDETISLRESEIENSTAAIPAQSNEIVEIGEQNDSRYNSIYSNQTYKNERQSFGKDTQAASTKCVDKSSKNISGHPSFRDGYQKHMEQPETSNSRSMRSSLTNKSCDETISLRKGEIEHAATTPALDEVAIQAIISILNGHIKRFLLDEDFRTSLRHNSFASLNFVGFEEGLNTESKIIATLEQSMDTVERATEDSSNERELKKATLQLSIITGLNSDELRDQFTSGIPNSKLAACAHLYLSVIYKIQKKERIAAKHILQIFCDSPFQARTKLLPDLWDRVFLPHLSHLKLWYDSETNKSRTLNIVDKVYNENLDKGTYQFAVYYKKWLTEGAEIPLVPSISVSREGIFSNSSHLSSGVGGFSPQPVVSKKLYEEVFRHSHKLGSETEEHQERQPDVLKLALCARFDKGLNHKGLLHAALPFVSARGCFHDLSP